MRLAQRVLPYANLAPPVLPMTFDKIPIPDCLEEIKVRFHSLCLPFHTLTSTRVKNFYTYPQGALSAMPASLPFFFLSGCSSATAAHALHFSCSQLPARVDR